ncbi:MAG: glycosyltransferase family A protein [Kovacikia sp.]
MSQSEPTVSVIIPCYNQGQYLDEAVGSVFAQTYQSFELIVINDGSTDAATIELLQNYQKPRLKVIHTENRGPSAARNTGIQQALGRYILSLDGDDRIQPTYLEKAVPILESHSNVGIVYAQAEFFGAKTGVCELPTYSFPEILLGNMIFSFSFYRRDDWEKVGGYNENMVYGWEDYDFWLSLIELGREVVQIPEPLCLYRQVSNSRSEQLNRDRQISSYAQLFRNHPRLYTDHINTLFQHIVDLRDDVRQTHTHLGQTQVELAQAQQAQIQLSAIQNSKLGRLYTRYVKLKKRLGLKIDDYSDSSISSPSQPLDLL